MLPKLVSILLLALLAGAGPASAQSLPEGAPTVEEGAPALPILWKTSIGRGASAPALVQGERAYVAGARQEVRAFDAARRRALWSRKLARGFQAPPVLAAGTLIVVAPHPDARAYALDPATGETRWERKVGDVTQAPLADSARAFFVSLGGWVRALDLRSGKLLWETRLEGVFPGGALLTGGDLVVLSAAGVLWRLEAATGTRLGSHSLGSAAAPGLAGLRDGSGFLVATFDGRVQGFAPDLAPLPIDFRTARMLHAPATGAGSAILATRDRAIRAFDLPSGAPLWERPLAVTAAAPPAISPDGSRVAVGDLSGAVWTLAAADGRVLSRTPTRRARALPAWRGEELVVVTEDGALLLLGSVPAES